MPIYEFECKQCRKSFVVTETYSDHDRHNEACPKCGSKDVEQTITNVFAKTSKKS